MKVKLSFGQKKVILSLSILNIKSKTSFTKVVQLVMLNENVAYKVKVKLSFCHKAVILSHSKLNIESNNCIYKSCLVWYDI